MSQTAVEPHDIANRPVFLGDLLLDDRGNLWEVVKTAKTIQDNGIMKAKQWAFIRRSWNATSHEEYIRIYQAIKLANVPWELANLAIPSDTTLRKQLFHTLYQETGAAQIVADTIRWQRKQADDALRAAGIRKY